MPAEVYGDFEWDSEKSIANLDKHNIDFYNACAMFCGTIIPIRSIVMEDGELRFCCIGELQGKCFSIIYTVRGNRKRLISVRRARKNERRIYSS